MQQGLRISRSNPDIAIDFRKIGIAQSAGVVCPLCDLVLRARARGVRCDGAVRINFSALSFCLHGAVWKLDPGGANSTRRANVTGHIQLRLGLLCADAQVAIFGQSHLLFIGATKEISDTK